MYCEDELPYGTVFATSGRKFNIFSLKLTYLEAVLLSLLITCSSAQFEAISMCYHFLGSP